MLAIPYLILKSYLPVELSTCNIAVVNSACYIYLKVRSHPVNDVFQCLQTLGTLLPSIIVISASHHRNLSVHYDLFSIWFLRARLFMKFPVIFTLSLAFF